MASPAERSSLSSRRIHCNNKKEEETGGGGEGGDAEKEEEKERKKNVERDKASEKSPRFVTLSCRTWYEPLLVRYV